MYVCMYVIIHTHAIFNLFSNSNESGSFSTDGITQVNTTNNTFVQCTSTHLTSFAVLVDASGGSESVRLTVYHNNPFLNANDINKIYT